MGSNRHSSERCFGTAKCCHYAKPQQCLVNLVQCNNNRQKAYINFHIWKGRNVVVYTLISGKHTYFGHPVPKAPKVEDKIEK